MKPTLTALVGLSILKMLLSLFERENLFTSQKKRAPFFLEIKIKKGRRIKKQTKPNKEEEKPNKNGQ